MKYKYRTLTLLAVSASLLLGINFTDQVAASQAGKEMQLADQRLNQVYQKLISKIHNPTQKKQLIAAQRAWIGLRDTDRQFFGSYYTNSKGGLFYMTKLTKDRADYLQALIDHPPTNNGDDFGPEKYTD